MKIEGARVRVRDWRLSDLEAFAPWQEPGHAWQDFNGPYYPPPDPAEVVAGVRRFIEADRLPAVRRRLAIADTTSDALIGVVSWYWISEETHWLALGITLYDTSTWGQGLGYEALGLWCQYLWDAMPELVRLDLRTWSGNPGMMRLAEKLGFSEEARFRKARIVDGAWFDGLGYGVLRDEWDAAYPNGFGAAV